VWDRAYGRPVDAGRYRWVVLAVGTFAQASTAAFFLGLAAVTPALRAHYGLGVAGVGALVGVTSVGLVVTLVAWGSATDRFGERGVMAVGLVGASAALGAATLVRLPVAAGALLVAAGASGASVNAASGRAVLTWFPARRRGFAMAVRQTSVPLGAGAAAVGLPVLADRGGVPAVFGGLAAVCLLGATASGLWIREPPGRPAGRVAATASTGTVLRDRRLQRLSLAGGLLVVPQFLGSVLTVELLHTGRGMAAGTAAALLSLTQVLGAAGRLGNGVWSDRAGRLRPLRIVATAIAAGFALAALAFATSPVALLAVALVGAAALAISWNGLVFTAAGELAPPGRAATAMAMTNTANYVGAAVTGPLGGAVAATAGWSAMLLVGTLAALTALLALRGLSETPPSAVASGAASSDARPAEERFGTS
jgi:MFS family permease